MLSLIVKVQDKLYGLPSNQVEHIFPCPYIEDNKLNYHGKMIKVIDLAIFFKLRAKSHYTVDTPLIIVESKNKFALLVDEVLAVDSVSLKNSKSADWGNEKISMLELGQIFSGSDSNDE